MNPTPPEPAAAPADAVPASRWRVRLLGAVQARPAWPGLPALERFPSRAVAALLARLALAPGREHPREELIELLWPGVALDTGRNRLRQALSTLKALLEPAGPGGGVIEASRLCLRVHPGALASDVGEFEALLRAGCDAEAWAAYGGDFMPGHYEDWVIEERLRLAGLQAALQERLATAAQAAAAAAPGPAAAMFPAAAPTAARAAMPSPAAAPASAPVPAPMTGPPLPGYLTRLFGTELSTARLRALVLAQRLVCLVGAGGSGKTRLAVEVAAALREPAGWPSAGSPRFASICFVPLVACRDAAQMLEAIARALQLPSAHTAEALLPGLLGRPLLLVLDNFEQLPPAAAQALAELLARAPQLHLLVTSRTRLGLDGEQLLAAEPLPLPPPPPAGDAGATGPPGSAQAALAAAAANPAVALFVDRARAARAEFHLTARNLGAIVGLLHQLQGLPLAIELAASRVRSFSPAELLALLQTPGAGGQLALLQRKAGRSGQDPRHASMTAVIAWSWQLLPPPAQALLQALALFPGDASLGALAATSGLALGPAAAALDELLQHGLLRPLARPDAAAAALPAEPRVVMAEPVREFVLAQPADRDALQQRLRAWLLRWAAGLQPLPQPAAVAPELPLIHAQLAAAPSHPQAAADALALAVALRSYWDHDTLPLRLQQALEQALAHLPAQAADTALRADMHELLAYQRFGAGFAEPARAHAEAALALAGSQPARRARALVRRAWIEVAAGRAGDRAGPQHAQVRAQLEEALRLGRACGDRDAQARALHQLGVLTGHLHASPEGADPAAAEALFAQSQALWEALGDRRRALARLRNRAQCWRQLGRAEDAMAAYRLCESAAQAEGDWIGQIDSLISMAELLVQQRQWQAALQANQRALALCWQRWFRHGLAYALWNPPRVLARLRQPAAALQVMAFASVFWTSQFGPLGAEDERHIRRLRRLVAWQTGPAQAEALWQQGQALDVASAVQLVLAAG